MPHTIRLTDERTGRITVIPADAMHALMDAQAQGEARHGQWSARVMSGTDAREGTDARRDGKVAKERP